MNKKSKKIFLIHGLGGSADETWGKFPELLREDSKLCDFDVHLISYRSPNPLNPISFLKSKKGKGISEIANTLLTEIKAKCDFGTDEIILAGHSLGGIILTKILINLDDQGNLDSIDKVCFFDTPFEGSGLADITAYIPLFTSNFITNRHLRELCKNSYYLDDLLDRWANKDLKNSIDILNLIADDSKIVNKMSSKSLFRGASTEVIKDVGHLDIVKPLDTDSLVYQCFSQFILKKKIKLVS